MRLSLLPLLALVACDDAKIDIGDDTAGLSDTADTDVDDTADSDDTDDTGDTEPVTYSTLTFVLDGEADADTLQLDWLSEDFAVLGRLGGATITGTTVTIEVADPTEDDLIELTTGLYARYAIPYAYLDADGSGTHDEDEPIGAVGRVWAFYLTGAIPVEVAALGLVDGWNALWIEEGDRLPDLYPVDAIPLPTNLVPTLTATLSGTVGGQFSGDAQLALIPSVAFDGLPFGSLLYNQGLEAEWATSVNGSPPIQHITDLFGSGLTGAVEVPVAWEDTDADGFPSGGEAVIGPACAGADVAALFWIEPPTNPVLAFGMVTDGFPLGWVPVRANAAGFEVLSEAEATSLVVGGGCSFE